MAAGDGFENSKSVDLVSVVGMRSRKGCRILRGKSKQRFMASLSTRLLSRPQGTGDQVRRILYGRQWVNQKPDIETKGHRGIE